MFFDAASGAVTVQTSGTLTARSIDFTGFTGTFNLSGDILQIGDSVGGSFKLVSGMTWTVGQRVEFLSSSDNGGTGWPITTAGKSVGNLVFNGSGGKWQLQDALSLSSTSSITLTQGHLDTNSVAVAAGSVTGDNSNTRALTLGSSTITLNGSGTLWDFTSTTGLTIASNTGTVAVIANGPTLDFGSANWNGLAVTLSGNVQTATLTGSSPTLASLTKTGAAGTNDQLTFASDYTFTGNFVVNGNSVTNRPIVNSSSFGTARTLTVNGTINTSTNVDFQDITGAGSGSWNLASITGGSGDAGGNSGITFTTATTRYGVVAGSWNSTATWSTTSGGAGGASVPLSQDSVVLDASSAAGTYTMNQPRAGKDLTATNFTRTLSLNQTLYGNLLLGTGLTLTGSNTVTLSGRGTQNVTMATKTHAGGVTIQTTGSYSLSDAMTLTGTMTLTQGTLDLNNLSHSFGIFSSNNSNTRTLTMGSGTVSLTSTATATVWNITTSTGLTLNPDTSTIAITTTSANTRTFAGGSKTYNVLSYTVNGSTGQLDISGSNTFAQINFSDTTNVRTLRIPSSGTTTISTAGGMNITGTSALPMSLVGTSSGAGLALAAPATFIFLTVQNVTATPSGAVYVLDGVNTSNNVGIHFSPPNKLPSNALYQGRRPTEYARASIKNATAGKRFGARMPNKAQIYRMPGEPASDVLATTISVTGTVFSGAVQTTPQATTIAATGTVQTASVITGTFTQPAVISATVTFDVPVIVIPSTATVLRGSPGFIPIR